MSETDSMDMSRQEARRRLLLGAALDHAAFDGWTRETFLRACKDADLSEGEGLLACPRGELDLIAYWSKQLDREAGQRLIKADLKAMKIRERVRLGVMARLEAIGRHEEAARRARARLMLPDAATLAPQLLWGTADMIWRGIGDTSTDANFYSKRAILSAVYGSTLSTWLNEDDAEKAGAQAFLDRRIGNVMEFEKTKAQLKKMTADLPDLAAFLGRMRYGAGPRV